jgi:hypothetical protein
MATTTRYEASSTDHARVRATSKIPVDHYQPIAGKSPDYLEVRQTDRSKAYASNRTKPRKKKTRR